MSEQSTPRNHLSGETSPYLLQHAGNPVHWYPWGEAAFAEARRSGKPILLSIGYSACHWCHVMAHESFQDAATAALMNRLFVNIKVDREERPDLDRIYQLAHELLTRHAGGWPLTMFLTHDDQRPFFGGTYFPPVPRMGRPSFPALLERVAAYYREQQSSLRQQGEALVQALSRIDATSGGPPQLDATPLATLRRALGQHFDRTWGGFGPAPKFPQPGTLERLLRDWRGTVHHEQPDLQALFMATLTLKRMADGGLRDQLGGGFARYSVDERWEIPHFEKMLYDNGQLLSVYAHAARATGDATFTDITADTAQYLLRDCRLEGGAFCASFDADSQGEEGRFYTWDPAEVSAVLEPEDAALFAARHGLDGPANFGGRWHLVARREIDELAAGPPFGPTEPARLAARLSRARATLLALRDRRPHPARDDKVLTAWNALAIKGLAEAARALGQPAHADAAAAAVDYLHAHHWRDERLLAVSVAGEARLPAYLDDHAFLLDALLALLETRFRSSDLVWAMQLADTLLECFEDPAQGGFFFTARDHEPLIHRSRSFDDGALPSGNAVAARALLHLGYLLGESRYLAAAERALRCGYRALEAQPLAHVHLATALEEYLRVPTFVVLRGDEATLRLWRTELDRLYDPLLRVIAIPDDAEGLPPALASRAPRPGTTAYLCRGATCDPPLDSLAALVRALQGEA